MFKERQNGLLAEERRRGRGAGGGKKSKRKRKEKAARGVRSNIKE